MNTKQQEYKTDIARLSEEMAKRELRMFIMVASLLALAVAILRFTE